MKFSTIFTLALASVALAMPTDAPKAETNAERFARGLPPAKPRSLFKASHARSAHQARHSHTPGSCPTGYSKLCCFTVGDTKNPFIKAELKALAMFLPEAEDVALTCKPFENQCHKTTTCCKETWHFGEVGVKCRAPY